MLVNSIYLIFILSENIKSSGFEAISSFDFLFRVSQIYLNLISKCKLKFIHKSEIRRIGFKAPFQWPLKRQTHFFGIVDSQYRMMKMKLRLLAPSAGIAEVAKR